MSRGGVLWDWVSVIWRKVALTKYVGVSEEQQPGEHHQ